MRLGGVCDVRRLVALGIAPMIWTCIFSERQASLNKPYAAGVQFIPGSGKRNNEVDVL